MTDWLIRRATEAGWPAIWPVWHEIVAAADTYAYDPDSSYEDARRSWLAPEPDGTWLATVGEAVVGTYHLGPNHAGPGAHIANASYMVARSARGHGWGRALVEHSLRRAREAGYLGVQFNAVATSNEYAIKLYHDLGFQTIGVVPGGFRHPQQGFVNLLIMYRSL
jgi:ribosomal protein S18 acetylase RimI-like enzyme